MESTNLKWMMIWGKPYFRKLPYGGLIVPKIFSGYFMGLFSWGSYPASGNTLIFDFGPRARSSISQHNLLEAGVKENNVCVKGNLLNKGLLGYIICTQYTYVIIPIHTLYMYI